MNLCFLKCITSHYCGQNAGLLKATPSLTDRKSAAAGYGRLGFSNSVGRPNLTSSLGEITPVEDADEVDQITLSSERGYRKGLSTLPRPLSTTKLSSPDNGVNIRIAYQGFPGAFSEAAALKLHPQCETVPCDEFETALEAVELLLVDKAVLPMECSVGGSIHYNYDLLLCHRLYIVGEVQMIANHHLLGLTGVRKVDKQDDSEKIARFQILAREPIIPGTDKPYKTSIVLTLKEGPGVLFKVLALFAMRDINLSKIESRPRKGQPLRDDFDNGRVVYFDYIFYIDFEASMAEPHAQNAMKHLQELTKFLRILGCYPVYALV